MKNKKNETVNFKDIIINVILKWRYVLAIAMVIALIFGLKQSAINMSSNKNEVEQKYQSDYIDYMKKLKTKSRKVERKLTDIDRQIEYNENSIKMKINPLNYYKGTLSIYIKANEIYTPELLYQSIQEKNKILDSYSEYVINGSFYDELVDKLSFDTKTNYIKEIVDITFSPNDQMLSVSVIQDNQALCKELLDIIYDLITKKRLEVVLVAGEHEITKTGETINTSADFDLEEFQTGKVDNIDTLNDELDILEEELEQYTSQAPIDVYDTNYLIKQGIKKAIIAFIAIAMIMGIYFFMIELFSGKLNSINNFKEIFNIPVIAEFNKKRKSKIDKWILKLGNRINHPLLDEDARIQLLSEVVQNFVLGNENTKTDSEISVYIIGTSINNIYDYYSKKIENATSKSCIKMIAGKDILSDISTVRNLNQFQYVLILEQFGISKYEKIEDELAILKRLNKKVIGSIVLDI